MSLRSGCVASLVVILAGALVIAGPGAGARSPRSPVRASTPALRLSASVLSRPGLFVPLNRSALPKLAGALHSRALRRALVVPQSRYGNVHATTCPVINSSSCSLKPCRVYAAGAMAQSAVLESATAVVVRPGATAVPPKSGGCNRAGPTESVPVATAP